MVPDSTRLQNEQAWQLTMQRLDQGKIELQLIPTVASRVLEVVNDPEISAHDLQKIILSDQVIAARVLEVANSPLFPAGDPVSSIRHAIVRLGYRKIFNIVLTTVLHPDLIHVEPIGVSYNSIWEHSLGCAMICRVIAATVNEDPEEAFTVGLMHDIGKLAFHQEIVLSRKEYPGTDSDFKEFIQQYHPALGEKITEQWNFPRRLTLAIRYHHHVEKAGETQRLTAIVNLGDMLCHVHGVGVAPEKLDLLDTMSAKVLEIQEFKLLALNEVASEAFKITTELFP